MRTLSSSHHMETDGFNRDQTQVQIFAEVKIICIRNLLHGKLRSDLRFDEAAAKIEKAVQEGKLIMEIKLITGQQ